MPDYFEEDVAALKTRLGDQWAGYLEGYTAGALAMKEAAAMECEGLALIPDEFDAAEIWCLVHAAKLIRALPVPPRGSKI